MLKPVTEWIQADQGPFLLVVLCSVTHDPYEVPQWFAAARGGPKDPVEKYRQAVSYTDEFLSALDVELANLNLADKTIFCVVGDHGEAFGEHGLRGHERIAFDEVLRIPFCLRAPFLITQGVEISAPVSSVDLTPTLLALLGFNVESGDFDGDPAIPGFGSLPHDRKVYFAGWMEQGPAGYVKGDLKFVHDPTDGTVWLYNLTADPRESLKASIQKEQARGIADGIIGWRKGTIFRLDQSRTGQMALFDIWHCKWAGRISTSRLSFSPHSVSLVPVRRLDEL
jgi:arylsulfatase A-like enzyme